LHIDVDWYGSTSEALRLYDLVVPGGLIILDDYGHWEGAKRAADEMRARYLLDKLPLHILDKTCRWFHKPEYRLRIKADADTIISEVEKDYPKARNVLEAVRGYIPGIKRKREIAEYQAAALYGLAKSKNHERANILEIGTAHGYSAAVMAEGCRRGHITTLNPKQSECVTARTNLHRYANVRIVKSTSEAYLVFEKRGWQLLGNDIFDLIFVDGDHNNVQADLPYWNYLKPGGLMLFHDYSPPGSWRECPPVYSTLNFIRDEILRRDFDILVEDEGEVGIAGWYKRRGEVMPPLGMSITRDEDAPVSIEVWTVPGPEDAKFAAKFDHRLQPDGSIDMSGIKMVTLNMETGEFEDDYPDEIDWGPPVGDEVW